MTPSARLAAGLRNVNTINLSPLSEEETALLFGLLDIAVGVGVPVSGHAPSTGSTLGVRLTLTPAETSTSVVTVRGVLHLNGLALTVSSAAGAAGTSTPGRRR